MSDISFIRKLDIPFRFIRRPSSVPGELRMTWGIALLLMIVLNSRSKRTSLQRLHVLNWASRSAINREIFEGILTGEKSASDFIPRVEPSLNRAIQFAVAEKLVVIDQGKRVALTARGFGTAEEINKGDALVAEKSFLKRIKSVATERRIDQLLNWSVLL